jgi:hypothetical protein
MDIIDIAIGVGAYFLGKKSGEKETLDKLQQHMQNSEIEKLKQEVVRLQNQVQYRSREEK